MALPTATPKSLASSPIALPCGSFTVARRLDAQLDGTYVCTASTRLFPGATSSANSFDLSLTRSATLIEICDKSTGAVLHRVAAKHLIGANLRGLALRAANLARANLERADLSSADLEGADLAMANLSRANLTEANLIRARLQAASLTGATLTRAELGSANLHNATLFQADLNGAHLEGARLTGADLDQANLTGVDLADAVFNERTRWPAKFDPLAYGAILMPDA